MSEKTITQKKEQKIFVTIALFTFGFLFLAFTINSIAEYVFYSHEHTQVVRVENGIHEDLVYAFRETKQVVQSEILNEYIAHNDREHTLSLLDEEKNHRHLGTMVAVNKDGIALARVPAIGIYGDYVAQTQPWGRAVIDGKENVAMIGIGRTYPLVSIAAYPIKEGDEVVGAVYGGFRFDDTYAQDFKKKYLDERTQIVFYSTKDGLLGSTHTTEVNNILANYFAAHSAWIADARNETYVRIGTHTYIVKNIVIPNPEAPEESAGGILVFLPVNFLYIEIILIASFTIITLLFLYRNLLRARNRNKLITFIFIAACAILAGVLISLANIKLLNQHTTVLHKAPLVIYNSTLAFSPEANLVDLHAEQRITLQLKTGGESINAVGAVIHYDPASVEVTNVLTKNSLCSNGLFLEKSIDNKKGEVRLSCVILPPAFSENNGVVAEIFVQPKKIGSFSLSWGEGTQVLANDGLGTNVLREATNASFQVNSLQTISSILPNNNGTLSVFSPSHSNSERWYKSNKIRAFWPAAPGFQYVSLLDQSPSTTPQLFSATTTNALTLSVEDDGVYYLHVARMKNNLIGPVTNLRLNIDTTPPEPPLIKASALQIKPGEIVRFEFASMDNKSGLERNFYVNIDNSLLLPTLAQLYIPFSEEGRHIVAVRVFDNAGNSSESSVIINVKK